MWTINQWAIYIKIKFRRHDDTTDRKWNTLELSQTYDKNRERR